MATRLQLAFEALRAERRTGLVAFATAGDPDLPRSERVLLALDRGGADVIEVGVPFSDPVADGPVIQRASERALAAGATLEKALDLCEAIRPRVAAPLVLFTYLNPILKFGEARFVDGAARAGIDGLLVVDLPVEGSARLGGLAKSAGIDRIHLVSPTTNEERIRELASTGSGFLYAISSLGVTGVRGSIGDEAQRLVARIRRVTELPVAVGFGISRPEQVREVGRWAEAAVVGSSIVSLVAESAGRDDLADRVEAHVRWLTGREPAAPKGER